MLKLIVAALVVFLVYSSPQFRSFTLEALQNITNLIEELPEPESPLIKELPETESPRGISTYE